MLQVFMFSIYYISQTLQLLSRSIDREECKAALDSENMTKSRFRNILPGRLGLVLATLSKSLVRAIVVTLASASVSTSDVLVTVQHFYLQYQIFTVK